MKKREFKISFFLHVWEKKAEEISLEEFHNDLRGARWKVLAESYRRWMQTGMTEEGKRLKGALNAVVVAGKCRGGHAANQVSSALSQPGGKEAGVVIQQFLVCHWF